MCCLLESADGGTEMTNREYKCRAKLVAEAHLSKFQQKDITNWFTMYAYMHFVKKVYNLNVKWRMV